MQNAHVELMCILIPSTSMSPEYTYSMNALFKKKENLAELQAVSFNIGVYYSS